MEFFLDILINKRLYSAPFKDLNDPMEGVFFYSQSPNIESFINQLVDEKHNL